MGRNFLGEHKLLIGHVWNKEKHRIACSSIDQLWTSSMDVIKDFNERNKMLVQVARNRLNEMYSIFFLLHILYWKIEIDSINDSNGNMYIYFNEIIIIVIDGLMESIHDLNFPIILRQFRRPLNRRKTAEENVFCRRPNGSKQYDWIYLRGKILSWK